MKPTQKQLETIFFLFNDYEGRTHGDICQDIWNYVESELNKIYPLPDMREIKGFNSHTTEYNCHHCESWTNAKLWGFKADQNVSSCTCPNCGAIHSEMIG